MQAHNLAPEQLPCIMPVATELLDWMPAIGSKSITGDESPTATLCLIKGVISCLGCLTAFCVLVLA
jgi:hypothetical protein